MDKQINWEQLEAEISAGSDVPDWNCKWVIEIIKRHFAVSEK